MRISEYQRTEKSHANTMSLPSFEKASIPKTKVYPLKNKLLIALFKNTIEIDPLKTHEKTFSRRCMRYNYSCIRSNHLRNLTKPCFCLHIHPYIYEIPKVNHTKKRSCKNQLVSKSKYLYTRSYKVN